MTAPTPAQITAKRNDVRASSAHMIGLLNLPTATPEALARAAQNLARDATALEHMLIHTSSLIDDYRR